MKNKALLQRGLTLIDVLIVLAVLSVALGLSAGSMKRMLLKHRLEGKASEVMADLQFARSEVVARNRSLRIGFAQDADGSCYVIHAGGTCSCSGNGAASCDATATLIKVSGLPTNEGVALSTNAASITLDPRLGTFSPTATLRLTADSGLEIRHVVNLLGRVRSCSPGRAVSGYPTC